MAEPSKFKCKCEVSEKLGFTSYLSKGEYSHHQHAYPWEVCIHCGTLQ